MSPIRTTPFFAAQRRPQGAGQPEPQPVCSHTPALTFGKQSPVRRTSLVGTFLAGLGLTLSGCASLPSRTPDYPPDTSTSQSPSTSTTSSQPKPTETSEPQPKQKPTSEPDTPAATAVDLARYEHQNPKEWGMNTTGVITRLNTTNKAVALTFDFCGSSTLSKGYDAQLIDFLRREQIPATLFINERWIQANPEITKDLAADPLFEVENHGTLHVPLSVEPGHNAYNIPATRSAQEVQTEIDGNAQTLEALTGQRPHFFRPGTAHSDEVANQLAADLGQPVVGFAVNGDGGASFSAQEVLEAYKTIKPGDIVISHGNHPEGQTAEGVELAVKMLKQRGYEFHRLMDGPVS